MNEPTISLCINLTDMQITFETSTPALKPQFHQTAAPPSGDLRYANFEANLFSL